MQNRRLYFDNNAATSYPKLPAVLEAMSRYSYALDADWVEHWANEIEFVFEKPKSLGQVQ